MKKQLDEIKQVWDEGKFILVYDDDDREGEVDMIIPSSMVMPHHIAEMRLIAGGMICCAVTHDYASKIGLPFITDIYQGEFKDFPLLEGMSEHKLPYGATSSFSVAINHKDCFTGITDKDRALTISTVGKIANEIMSVQNNKAQGLFSQLFRAPGHVPMLRAKEGLLRKREGHTELSLALCELLGYAPSTVMCEMMDAKTYLALPIAEAKIYGRKMGYPLIKGKTIKELWFGSLNEA